MDVGYNTNYRDRTWVPVEVIIANEQRDFAGWIEVRTYQGNTLQSPVYRIPAECPQNSRKRFTLNAYIDGADRVEAWLYEGGRVAVDAPAYVQISPIAPADLMALVLDDDPANFGFLYAAVQPRDRAIRLFRHGLPTSDLGRLPTVAPAYDAFDVVIMGDIQPDRVPIRHRALIRQYVERGGTLVVCTGLRAVDYRGSWVEPLLGVELPSTDIVDGVQLARQTLPEAGGRGAKQDRQAVVAQLVPTDDGVTTVGGDRVLAARHQRGRGWVYTLAVDAKTHVLQDTPGFHTLWRSMITAETPPPPLNIESFTRTLAQLLPNLSGVTIRSLSWVMTYLLLYIGIGVVGNWLFWNFLKRREMAWLCLIVFSLAFTGYAILFGRAGWDSPAELQQIDVIHLQRDHRVAHYHSTAGILTSRTRTYSAATAGQEWLVRDAAAMSVGFLRRSAGMSVPVMGTQPFYWYQQDEPRIERLRVGASELRLVYLRGDAALPGPINGAVRLSAEGVRADLTNDTGLPIDHAALLHDGYFLPLAVNGESFRLAMSRNQLRNFYSRNTFEPNSLNYIGYAGRIDTARLRELAQAALFVDDSMQLGVNHPVYFVGWCSETTRYPFRPDQPLQPTVAETLLVAEVEVVDTVKRRNTPLALTLGEPPGTWYRRIPFWDSSAPLRAGARGSAPMLLRVQLPSEATAARKGVIELHLYWQVSDLDYTVQLAPFGWEDQGFDFAREWHEEHVDADPGPAPKPREALRTVYRLREWSEFLDPGYENTLRFHVVSMPETAERELEIERFGIGTVTNGIGEFAVAARFIPDEGSEDSEGAWPQWQ